MFFIEKLRKKVGIFFDLGLGRIPSLTRNPFFPTFYRLTTMGEMRGGGDKP